MTEEEDKVARALGNYAQFFNMKPPNLPTLDQVVQTSAGIDGWAAADGGPPVMPPSDEPACAPGREGSAIASQLASEVAAALRVPLGPATPQQQPSAGKRPQLSDKTPLIPPAASRRRHSDGESSSQSSQSGSNA